eukprot:gnl/MRDRNA2_/MRDRNA2_138530_c0_seq1.p1 gnl/MRDRNA2_/MRDRNA2_138530_c0~~gnl/MRDRNA2_/MRDRNA2_138530_c0_seq1.p1  ORF type:complete len:200 (-),score=34.31 gnl/MRDRNA2_/MRDRNA2_138530_c0_seq1:270-869(-)
MTINECALKHATSVKGFWWWCESISVQPSQMIFARSANQPLSTLHEGQGHQPVDSEIQKFTESLPPLQILMPEVCSMVYSKDQAHACSESRRLTQFLEKEGFQTPKFARATEKMLLELPEQQNGIPLVVLALLVEKMARKSQVLPPLRKSSRDVPTTEVAKEMITCWATYTASIASGRRLSRKDSKDTPRYIHANFMVQ